MPPQTLNHPQGLGRDKDVAREAALPRRPQAAASTSSKPAHVQVSLEMARPGIEPGTPRFSEGGENPWLTADLQDFFW
jgi:hypothetical protein